MTAVLDCLKNIMGTVYILMILNYQITGAQGGDPSLDRVG